LLPKALVGVGREAVLVVERAAAVTLSGVISGVVGFPRLRLGLEGATATELAGVRVAVVPEPLLQTVVGVGREPELLAGRKVSPGFPSLLATVVGFPRFKLGLVRELALGLAPVRETGVWLPLLPA
jgi:hypothetical protein